MNDSIVISLKCTHLLNRLCQFCCIIAIKFSHLIFMILIQFPLLLSIVAGVAWQVNKRPASDLLQ